MTRRSTEKVSGQEFLDGVAELAKVIVDAIAVHNPDARAQIVAGLSSSSHNSSNPGVRAVASAVLDELRDG